MNKWEKIKLLWFIVVIILFLFIGIYFLCLPNQKLAMIYFLCAIINVVITIREYKHYKK